MINEQDSIKKKEMLINTFNQILEGLNNLGDWNFSNASKLERLNTKRHELADEMIGLGLQTITSWAYGSDETDKEVSIAQETRPKRKNDIPFYESNYYKAIRHLKNEIEQYLNTLNQA